VSGNEREILRDTRSDLDMNGVARLVNVVVTRAMSIWLSHVLMMLIHGVGVMIAVLMLKGCGTAHDTCRVLEGASTLLLCRGSDGCDPQRSREVS
jgi:hypothetical protein